MKNQGGKERESRSFKKREGSKGFQRKRREELQPRETLSLSYYPPRKERARILPGRGKDAQRLSPIRKERARRREKKRGESGRKTRNFTLLTGKRKRSWIC